MKQRIAILGSTGSIGRQTLEVIRANQDLFEVETITANNNWELLEEICEKIYDKDDIWYATNMEIYEYVNAYNSLVYSADGTIIYNPTLFELYFDIDGVEYKIGSGETLKI